MSLLKSSPYGSRIVNGEQVDTVQTKLHYHSALEVEAGTNGEHGGASKYGSRTYIRLKDLSGFDIESKTSSDGKEVEITIGGDCELQQIQDALTFILATLKNQQKETKLRNLLATKFDGYILDEIDRDAIKFWAPKLNLEHFSNWVDAQDTRGWRQVAVGGPHLLIGSYDDAFDILNEKEAAKVFAGGSHTNGSYLTCPVCGNFSTHVLSAHARTGSDSCEGGKGYVGVQPRGKTSSRRDALCIGVECESGCKFNIVFQQTTGLEIITVEVENSDTEAT
jgi:hypothetical protein